MSNYLRLICIAALLALNGCAQNKPLPDSHYESFANQSATLSTCIAANEFNHSDASRYAQAMQFNLSTWASYDSVKLQKLTAEKQSMYSPYASNIKEWCAQVRIFQEGSVSNANNYKQQQQRNHEINRAKASAPKVQSSSSSFSNRVQCVKIGAFINQEVKTFNGMVCPIGWLPAY